MSRNDAAEVEAILDTFAREHVARFQPKSRREKEAEIGDYDDDDPWLDCYADVHDGD